MVYKDVGVSARPGTKPGCRSIQWTITPTRVALGRTMAHMEGTEEVWVRSSLFQRDE